MSSAFTRMDAAIFRSTILGAIDAVYRAGGAGEGTTVRIIRDRPSVDAAGFGVSLRAGAERVSVRTSEVATLAAGDTFTIGSEVLVVRGAPAIDAIRAVWTAEC